MEKKYEDRLKQLIKTHSYTPEVLNKHGRLLLISLAISKLVELKFIERDERS